MLTSRPAYIGTDNDYQRENKASLHCESIAKLRAEPGASTSPTLQSRSMAHPFFTVGHSTHTVEELVDLLREREIELVIDVRSIPRSRRNPQFNGNVLPTALAGFGLDYVHLPELGGLRGRCLVPPAVNAFWTNESFHNYADYTMDSAFRAGLRRLRELGRARRSVIMCA